VKNAAVLWITSMDSKLHICLWRRSACSLSQIFCAVAYPKQNTALIPSDINISSRDYEKRSSCSNGVAVSQREQSRTFV
jgi:hypothetical protein